ncbi:RsmB/NOP family class I SAM-dependent RNA methyltransferase [Parvularcula dongshanensis]|uniref:16S rRNA (Cytosine967-C5)-methyltransferase n=1 Tax=Parvularcula dongshanensis TaxID=1173995 RepID=A0A840HYD8_9PROT|nr:RsmB/NOP family class I SAM-dependent RNA methyltransferase [Parvularcula dongshanensis]MBB4657589.1 16S rRNA (cytosine967-C5)-methyltransferase [Parvularcula dongshanensis]
MRDGGRIAAAKAVLDDFWSRRVPLKVALADWGRGARYAGSKDRAFVSGLCLDALRRWRSLRGEESVRIALRLTLEVEWGWTAERVAAAFGDAPHGPGALEDDEQAAVPLGMPDVPAWCLPLLERAGNAAAEVAALSARAPVDLRVNTLKATSEQAAKACATIGAQPAPIVAAALRVPAPPAAERAPAVTVIPAYGRGWVEVQDEGSQIAGLCAGQVAGAQVLDLCAGGGGKTLELAALMENKGQIFAYDADPRRLAPIHERLRRAGVRNVQVRSPAAGEGLDDLEGRMDLVLVDAPCSGSGTWRRRPDTKWRLTEAQLAERIAEQDQVLAQAAHYVKPGGVLLYVTCSVFREENDDRIDAFLAGYPAFERESAAAAIPADKLTAAGRQRLSQLESDGALRLSPANSGTDGFTITRLRRAP